METAPLAQPVAVLAGTGRVAGADGALLGGYGPFVALVAAILAMALLAPTIAPERDVTTRSRPAPAAAADGNRLTGEVPTAAADGHPLASGLPAVPAEGGGR